MVQEVVINPLGLAVIICPECGASTHTKPRKELQHQVLDRTCKCGAKHQVIFDTRSEHRKKCSLPGILLADDKSNVEIKNISEKGAYFEGDELNLNVGSIYHLKIKIRRRWIEVLVRIIRTNEKMAGIEFVYSGDNERKMIESYILSH